MINKDSIRRNWIPSTGTAWIYAPHQNNDLAYFRELAAEAKRANPELIEAHISFNLMKETNLRRVFACEFPCRVRPAGYITSDTLPSIF